MNKLQAKNISMSFASAQHTVDVLADISLMLNEGQSIGIIGSSGCGKTTLLQIYDAFFIIHLKLTFRKLIFIS